NVLFGASVWGEDQRLKRVIGCMRRRSERAAGPARVGGFAACVVALTLALALPALQTRRLSRVYRPIGVRQSAARHCSVDLTDDRGVRSIARPAFRQPIAQCLTVVRIPRAATSAQHPRLLRLLVRLRFGARRAADPRSAR